MEIEWDDGNWDMMFLRQFSVIFIMSQKSLFRGFTAVELPID